MTGTIYFFRNSSCITNPIYIIPAEIEDNINIFIIKYTFNELKNIGNHPPINMIKPIIFKFLNPIRY